MNKQVYTSPEMTVFGTVEELTAGDKIVGIGDAILFAHGLSDDPTGGCRPDCRDALSGS